MPTSATLITCPCCGKEKPAFDFPNGRYTCSICCMLPGDEAALITRETVRRELAVRQFTSVGRKQARVDKRMEEYARNGKRCTACHHKKPAADYNKCAPQPDGLQPICRQCNELRVTSMRHGGMAAWHTVRDAMRASSPEGK